MKTFKKIHQWNKQDLQKEQERCRRAHSGRAGEPAMQHARPMEAIDLELRPPLLPQISFFIPAATSLSLQANLPAVMC